jgi:hypothetical protein
MTSELPPIHRPEPPPSTNTSGRKRKRLTTLVEHEETLFELTEAKFATNESLADAKHRPVHRVRTWDDNGDQDETTFAPNLSHLVTKLNALEECAPKHMKPHAEFDQEMKASDIRLRLVQRGCSLPRLLKARPKIYTPLEPKKRYAAVSEIIEHGPARLYRFLPYRRSNLSSRSLGVFQSALI